MTGDPRRLLRVALLAVLGVLVVVGGLVARDVDLVRDDLVVVRDRAGAAASAAREGDIDRATRLLEEASSRSRRVVQRRATFGMGLARHVPVVGEWIGVLDEISATVDATLEVGDLLVDAAGDLAERDGTGGIPVSRLDGMSRALGGTAMRRVADHRDHLAVAGARWIPSALDTARRDTLEVADEVLSMAASVHDVLDALLPFLGADEPRRYVVAMQNSAELRGTGGLIGFHALLTLDRGRAEMSVPETDRTFRHAAEHPLGPGVLGDRYAPFAAAPSLGNANLDPDLPTAAPAIEALYASATGIEPDGLIAIDPVGLASLLADEPPLAVPRPAGRAGRALPRRIRMDDFARVVLVDAYDVLGGESPEREAYHAAVAGAAFGRLAELSWRPQVLRRLGLAVAGRHVQVHSIHTEEQEAFQRLGVAGHLAAPVGHDLLAITANNSGGNKQDVHVRHGFSGEIHLSPDERGTDATAEVVRARRTTRVGIRVDNPLQRAGRDDYISGVSVAGVGRLPELSGMNRTWFTVWAPGTSGVVGGAAGDAPLPARVDHVRELVAVDHVLDTPPTSSAEFELALEGPVDLRVSPAGALSYDLTLWHQSKAVADHLSLQVTVAEGWVVTAASVTGRADAAELGFGERSQPMTATVVDGTARVSGTATSDVQVHVELTRTR